MVVQDRIPDGIPSGFFTVLYSYARAQARNGLILGGFIILARILPLFVETLFCIVKQRNPAMKGIIRTTAALLTASFLATALAGADQIIELYSGNGTVGGADSQVTFAPGPLDAAFGTAFTPASFNAASSGAAATVINNHPAWITAAAFNANASTAAVPAQWISNSPIGGAQFGDDGSSALYAIEFTITDTIITAASIDFDFAVDNIIGGGPNQGLFINGTALSGSTSGGGFDTVTNFTRTDIAPLLVTGVNTLYINMTDVGGPAGLIFSTTINIEGSTTVAVPEPGLIAVFALGLAGIGFGRWAHNRRI